MLSLFKLVVESFISKFQDGFALSDIEATIFFILFIRLIILAIRYNLKTSFFITSIGLFAGYLWYRHLVDIISTYSNLLVQMGFLQNFGQDAVLVDYTSRQGGVNYSNLGEDVHWYQPGKLIYSGIMKAIINIDPETGQKYYIDPFSMIISKFRQSGNSEIVSFYYQFYKKIIPKVFDVCSKFWTQLSGIAAYATITRIGKRYCPYLIRWHWTFLLIIMMIEQIFITFVNRATYFTSQVLSPQIAQLEVDGNSIDFGLNFQTTLFNVSASMIVAAHIGFLIFGLFHAILGQYFYFPFLVENTELHIGSRPSNSIYSGGMTSWQDPAEKENTSNRKLPKIWYGWFGRGTKEEWFISSKFKQFINKIIKNLKKQFRR